MMAASPKPRQAACHSGVRRGVGLLFGRVPGCWVSGWFMLEKVW